MKPSWAKIEIRGEKLLFGFFPLLMILYVFTPWRPIQFLVLFCVFIILFCRIYSEYLIRHLKLRRGDSELRGFRHEWIGMELIVENHGRLPAFMLAVTDTPGRLPVFRDNKGLYTLYGRRSRQIQWQAFGTSRGLFALGPGVVRGADPLGLFPFTLAAKETTRLFVYPAPAYVSLKIPKGIPLGVIISANPFNEDLTRRRSVREYLGGDELRRINWKASARLSGDRGTDGIGSGLMVNEYEASLSYPLMVFLNLDPLEYAPKNRELFLERVIETGAALCIMASRDRQTLGLILHSSPLKKGELISPSAFALIPALERLAVFERPTIEEVPSDDNGAEPLEIRASVDFLIREAKSLAFGTRLVYAGPSLKDNEYQLLEGLKSSHLSLEYLFIDEKSLTHKPGAYQIKERGYEIL